MADLKQRIAKRCAKEFKDGEFANLGIGLPTMVADYIPDDIMVTFHSENGFAGIDAMADESNLDVDIINSGGSYVTAVDRVKYLDTAESFGLVRGGHVRATVLGAMEVAENGDLANWIVPMLSAASCRKVRSQDHTRDGRYGSKRSRYLGS